jgi:hypothetical protein
MNTPVPNRKRIAIFIDYALRVPSFNNAYSAFKKELFADTQHQFDVDDMAEEGEQQQDSSVVNFYWREQLKNKDVEDFYVKSKVEKEDADLINSDFKEYFYNTEHWQKFIEDYSFNLYADAEVPCKNDVVLINITQQYLFDVVLVDEYITTRKKSNTLFYLSKIRVFPQSVLFLGPGQQVNEANYFAIWNPKKDDLQINQEGMGEFEMWLKGLELDWKKETFGNGEGEV